MNVTLALPFISADYPTAAAAIGCSVDTLQDAVRKGDLVPRYLGKRSTKPVLLAVDLIDWLGTRPTEKPRRSNP